MRFGNTLVHCYYKLSSDIYGGVPPTLYYIQTESQMFHLFVNNIFVHNTGLPYKTKSKHILATSVLKLSDAFLGIIGNKTSGKYKYRSHHPLHQNIVSIIFELNISDETFDKWKKEVIHGFND